MLGRRALIHRRQNGIGCDESTVRSIRQLLEAPMPVMPVGERVIGPRVNVEPDTEAAVTL